MNIVKTVDKKVPWWKPFICKIKGHITPKNINDSHLVCNGGGLVTQQAVNNFSISLPINTKKKAYIILMPCERCGIYAETRMEESFTEDDLLTEDEKIVKDIIT